MAVEIVDVGYILKIVDVKGFRVLDKPCYFGSKTYYATLSFDLDQWHKSIQYRTVF